MASRSLDDQRIGPKRAPARVEREDLIAGLRKLARGDGLSPATSGRLLDELESGAIAVEKALAWIHDPNDQEEFERIAGEFYRATGFTRPGKDDPVAGSVHPDTRQDAWDKWRHARSAAVRADLIGFIKRVRGT